MSGRPKLTSCSAPRLRVAVAEDSVLLREGIAELLVRFGHEVVAAVGSADDLITAVAEHEPDVVISDVRMPPGHTDEGLRAAVSLRARYPGLGILVLSQFIATTYANELLGSTNPRFGGLGYLLKDRVSDVDEFMVAVHEIAEGRTVIDPLVLEQLLAERPDSSRPIDMFAEPEPRFPAGMAEWSLGDRDRSS